MKKFFKTLIFPIIFLFINVHFLNAQVERKTRNGAWILYSKAKTINGLGLSVNPFSETEEYLNTTVNGVNLQVGIVGPFLTMEILIRSIFNAQFWSDFPDSSHLNYHNFPIKLVTNGVNVKSLSLDVETTNGISIKLIDINNFNNGLSVSFIARRQSVKGLAISVFNADLELKGVQIGLINKSKHTKGFQFGLWNVNEKRSFPFINWCF
jgi:hypothetical protein